MSKKCDFCSHHVDAKPHVTAVKGVLDVIFQTPKPQIPVIKTYNTFDLLEKFQCLPPLKKLAVMSNALDYMSQFNGRSRTTCLIMGMGYLWMDVNEETWYDPNEKPAKVITVKQLNLSQFENTVAACHDSRSPFESTLQTDRVYSKRHDGTGLFIASADRKKKSNLYTASLITHQIWIIGDTLHVINQRKQEYVHTFESQAEAIKWWKKHLKHGYYFGGSWVSGQGFRG
jgi:hypothetical protein